MAYADMPGLARPLTTSNAGNGFLWKDWAVAPAGLQLALLQTRAAATFQPVHPSLGAEVLEFLIDASGLTSDVIMLVRWGLSDADVAANMFPESQLNNGALAAGLQRVAVNEAEFLITQGTRRKLSIPTASHFFTLGAYTDAAPGGTILTCAVSRRVSFAGANQ